MASLRDVKIKIGAIKKTKQITKAMNMVASAKLRNAQSRIERFKPYAQKFFEMLGDLAAGADESVHPLLAKREEKKKGEHSEAGKVETLPGAAAEPIKQPGDNPT